MRVPGAAEPGQGMDGQHCGTLFSKVCPPPSKDYSGTHTVPCSGASVASRSTTASEASDVLARQLTATLHASLQAERYERMAAFDLLKQDVEAQRDILEELLKQRAAGDVAYELGDLRSKLSMQQHHQDVKFAMIEDALRAAAPCAPSCGGLATEHFRGPAANDGEMGRLRQDLAAFKEEQELVFSALQSVLADVRSDHERLLASGFPRPDQSCDGAAEIAAAELPALQRRVSGIAMAVDCLKGDLESEVARRCSNLAQMQSTMLSELADIRRRAENEIGCLKASAECKQHQQKRSPSAAAALLEAAGGGSWLKVNALPTGP